MPRAILERTPGLLYNLKLPTVRRMRAEPLMNGASYASFTSECPIRNPPPPAAGPEESPCVLFIPVRTTNPLSYLPRAQNNVC